MLSFFFRPNVARMCKKRDVDGLVRLMMTYKSNDFLRELRVRAAAAEALGTLRDPAAVPPLIAVLKDTAASSPKTAAATALGMIGDARAVNPLSAVLREAKAHSSCSLSQAADRSLHVYLRQAVIEALGSIQNPRTIEPLIDALSDPDRSTREMAVACLAEKRDPRAVTPLERALYSGTWLAREATIVAALTAIGGSSAESALKDWQRVQQAAAAKAEMYEQLRQSTQEDEGRRRAETAERVRSLQPEIDRLTDELLEIGRRGGFLGQGKARTRVIGERLDAIGGIELMRKIGQRVAGELGAGSGGGRELEADWNGIGSWHG